MTNLKIGSNEMPLIDNLEILDETIALRDAIKLKRPRN